MQIRPPLIERAYDLAESGTIKNATRLVLVLTREGYENVEAHIRGGSSLRKELTGICRKAWIKAGNAPAAHSDKKAGEA